MCNFMVDSYRDKDVVAYFLLPACLFTAGFNYLIHDYLQKKSNVLSNLLQFSNLTKYHCSLILYSYFQKAVQRIKEISVKVKKDDKG